MRQGFDTNGSLFPRGLGIILCQSGHFSVFNLLVTFKILKYSSPRAESKIYCFYVIKGLAVAL